MKSLPFTFLFAFLLSCQIKEIASVNTIRIPGEFEPQEAIWLGFKTIENGGRGDSITTEIIRAIHPYVDVKLVIENDTLVGDVFAELHEEGIDTTNIELIFQAGTDIQYRDPGPVFALANESELKIIDFNYTNYSNVFPDSISERAKVYESLDRDIANRLGIDTINAIVALEGGAFESNGQGVLIQVEEVTLGRNPHLTQEEIEADFKRCCGIEKVIWLSTGIADDPLNLNRIHQHIYGVGTGGHTDEFVRFANDSTILLAWVTEEEKDEHPISQLNYKILRGHYEILSRATNLEGR